MSNEYKELRNALQSVARNCGHDHINAATMDLWNLWFSTDIEYGFGDNLSCYPQVISDQFNDLKAKFPRDE